MARVALAVLIAFACAALTAPLPVGAAQRSPHGPSTPAPASPRTPLAASSISAGGAWNWQNPQPNGSEMFAISCPSTSTCFAAGEDGPILMTSNGGTTWAQQQSVLGVFGLSCASTADCVGVGYSGEVVTTSNGGSTWQTQFLGAGAITFLVGVSCATTAVCYATGDGGRLYKSSNGGGTWTQLTSGTTSDLFGVTCLTSTSCFAVGAGGVILQTTDGSAWNALNSGVTSELDSISCASASLCVAVGQGGTEVTTHTGGSSWVSGTVTANVLLASVSCPSTTMCFIASNDGQVYAGLDQTYGAASVDEPGGLWSVSCPAPADCFVAGDHGIIAKTTVAGSGWSVQSLPAASGSLRGISCPTTTTCFATGLSTDNLAGLVYETINGGSSWAQVLSLPGSTLNPSCSGVGCQLEQMGPITCPTSSVCMGAATASEGFVYRTTDGGTTWHTVQAEGGSTITGISCPSTSVCVLSLAGGWVQTSADGGATWGSEIAVANTGGLTGVSCPITTLCFASDGGTAGKIYSSANGGATWQLSFDLGTDPQRGPGGLFTGIDCPTTTSCDAVGLQGQTVTTNDGGANWRTDNPTRRGDLRGVSCPTVEVCFAAGVGPEVLVTHNSGSDWDNQFTNSLGLGSFEKISCPSTTVCFAVGDAGLIVATTNGGAAWSKSSPTGSTGFVASMSCPNSNDCYAAAASPGFGGGAMLVSHDGGGTWTQHAPNSGDEVNAMSCPAANTCYAAGWPGAIYRTGDGGSTWTPETNPMSAQDRSFTSISCSGASSCTLVGAEGQILTTADGTNWTNQPSPASQPLFGVACAAACVAVGAGGTAIYGSGASWQSGSTGISTTLASVSCVSSSVCYAVGSGGTVLLTTNGGASWTGQTSGVSDNLDDISCTSFSVCVAGGARGTVIYTLDGKTWTAATVPTSSEISTVALLNSGQAWLGGAGGTILENSSLFTAPTPTVTGVLPAAGPLFGESQVTMTGTGFTGGVSAVDFGGTPASAFSVTNDTTLTATVPAHALGTVDVTVTGLGGTSATSPGDQFTYEALYVYTAVAPQRLLDTRTTHNKLGPGGSVNLAIGGVTVPANARAVVLNVTAVDETTAGAFIVFPTGGAVPLASNLNWVPQKTVANLVTVGLGAGGQVTIHNILGSADAVVDLAGYYAPTPGGSAGEYVPVVPARITDTRAGSGEPNAGSTLGPGATVDIQVMGVGGIPAAGVTAVALNVTATDTTSAGYFTVYPTGGSAPLASNLNWTAGMTVPNRVIVKVGAGGKVSLLNGLGHADAVVDVGGYFTDATLSGSSFVPASPTRIVDTRNGTGGFSSPLGPGGTMVVKVAGAGGVPAMSASTPPQAVVINVTVTGPTQPDYLTVWPDGASRPLASDLNFVPGETVPNLVIVKLSPDGKIDIFNGYGSTHVIVDVVGWYG